MGHNFNPRPSCEGRLTGTGPRGSTLQFQSTPLMRGATIHPSTREEVPHDFNPRPSCEGRRGKMSAQMQPREFQSTPLMRGATLRPVYVVVMLLFQSTPLMRGATSGRALCHSAHHFNPRPSCEGRRLSVVPFPVYISISIHAPHARGDGYQSSHSLSISLFQSTPLMRGATEHKPATIQISYFNPRPSCEGRRISRAMAGNATAFQSTPLMRGATDTRQQAGKHMIFQSTPLMRGATRRRTPAGRPARYFNPRPSCEGRPFPVGAEPEGYLISIHAPHARGDADGASKATIAASFQSTPLMRGATSLHLHHPCMQKFQSTPLMRGATQHGRKRGDYRLISIHAPHARGDREREHASP